MNGYLPFLDLRHYEPSRALSSDVRAALAVAFLAIPQGVAYALIAGIPSIVGLYAATFPALIASMFRSSRHVVAGPTNAVSLLVGTAVIAHSELDPAVSHSLEIVGPHDCGDACCLKGRRDHE